MITSAGRLSNTISQGSPSRSAIRVIPMIRPLTEASAMVMTNATATRASVAPILKAIAPERASSIIAIATACGSGSRRAPASCDPAYQAARSRTSEKSLAPKNSLPRGRPVEGSGRELARRADQLGAADLREHPIERLRIRLLLGRRPAHDALAVALAVDRKRARVADADARRKPLPFVRRRGQDVLGLPRGVEEAVDGRAVARRPGAVEGVADDGDRSLRPQALHHVIHADGTALPLAFEVGAKVPERERGIALALHCLLRQERRRPVDDGRLAPEIDAGAACERLQQQPALVERTARHCELPALEIGDRADRRLRRRHHRAERARRRIEDEAVAERALARDPQPIRQHEVGRAAL